jgi:hypothetical protein
MRVQQWLLVGALAAMPALAAAQTTTTTTPDDTTTTTTQTRTQTTTVDFDDLDDDDPGGWFASAHIGSDFGQGADGNSTDFGGSLGYTNGWIGAEFLAGFTPNFALENNILLDEPNVNSYMFNVIGGVPVGDDFRFQPYVSGGLGALTLRSDVLSGADNDPLDGTFDPNDTQLGGNLGFGVMGFAGNIGIRGDVRYFRGFGDDAVEDALNLEGDLDPNTSPGGALASSILSDLDFWRANIGIAFRW